MKRRSMKAMKAKKAKTSMRRRRRAMKVSKVGRKWMVFKGTREKTRGGLKKTDLTKNKYGKVVSKKRSAMARRSSWCSAVQKARKALGVRGFCAVGGRTAKGQELLKKTRSFLKKWMCVFPEEYLATVYNLSMQKKKTSIFYEIWRYSDQTK